MSANTNHTIGITSLAGAASILVSAEADVAVADDATATTTTIAGDDLSASGTLDVEADTTRQVEAHAAGGAVAIGGAAGISDASSDIGGSAQVNLDGGVSNVGSAIIKATSGDYAEADATALAAGIGVAGEGALADASVSPTLGVTLDHANLTVAGDANIESSATDGANANSTGYALAGGISAASRKPTRRSRRPSPL